MPLHIFLSGIAVGITPLISTGVDTDNRSIRVPDDYPTIREAIEASLSGDEVVIAPGTWHESSLDPAGKAITIRSDDPSDSLIVAATVVDGDSIASVFTIHSGEQTDCRIAGLTIQRGYAHQGGGIYIEKSSPTIAHCIFRNNQSNSETDGGGAIYCLNAHPTILDSEFHRNIADEGAAVFARRSAPFIQDCRFLENWALDNGGAIALVGTSAATVAGSVFEGNRAFDKGGAGIYCDSSNCLIVNCDIRGGWADDGGGIHCYHASPTILRTKIVGNTAFDRGGGISAHGSSPMLVDCTINDNWAWDYSGGGISAEGHASPTFRRCRIQYNTAFDEGGGGLFLLSSEATLVNCTISDNAAGNRGPALSLDAARVFGTNCTVASNQTYGARGAISLTASEANLTNCIIWDNKPGALYLESGSSVQITHCDVAEGWPGVGNLNEDPLFVIQGSDRFLSPNSPCVDAGTVEGIRVPALDLDARPRSSDNVDMGASEYGATTPCNLTISLRDQPERFVPGTRIRFSVVIYNPCSTPRRLSQVVLQIRGPFQKNVPIWSDGAFIPAQKEVSLPIDIWVPPLLPVGSYVILAVAKLGEDWIDFSHGLTALISEPEDM